MERRVSHVVNQMHERINNAGSRKWAQHRRSGATLILLSWIAANDRSFSLAVVDCDCFFC